MGRILNWVMVWVVVFGGIFVGGIARGAEVIPPVPVRYFNDYAKVISPVMADDLNLELKEFEKSTSNQIVVAIYPKMQSDSDIADYTVRVAQAWRVGGKANNNGAVLFVFVQDRKCFIQVGYGLEGALPDATCKEIIDQQITPRFKTGDYDAGVWAGVESILAATRGEYKGTGATTKAANNDRRYDLTGWLPCAGGAIGLFLLFGLFLLVLHNMGGTFYQNHSRSIGFVENTYLFIMNMAVSLIFSAGSSSSSSSSSDSEGGFSSGGGSFGGGGAGGSW